MLQMLIMGIVGLYQIMSHRRSVLLTQIWAYRCQNGHMQVVYLAQVTYHLIYNSDAYFLGLTTGTLTTESLANLVFCFFVFSYCSINLAKARSGDQRLDRHFRLTWEALQPLIVGAVGLLLYQTYRTPLTFVLNLNGELLRKTTARGRRICNLSDSCIVYTVNLAIVFAVASTVLGLSAMAAGFVMRRFGRSNQNAVADSTIRARKAVVARFEPSVGIPQTNEKFPPTSIVPVTDGFVTRISTAPRVALLLPAISGEPGEDSVTPFNDPHPVKTKPNGPAMPSVDQLTSFERHCLGNPFERLFYDCGDIAYITHEGRRCSSVEAILLTGFLFYGEHVYRAQAIVLLLVGRWVPYRLLQTFNMLFTRWRVDLQRGQLDPGASCPWHLACDQPRHLVQAFPLA